MTYDDLTTGSAARLLTPTGEHPGAGAFEALADAAELAIAVLGVDGALLHANVAGARLFGLSAGAERISTDALRIVLDQIPKQLLTGPDGGTWSGEISFGSVLGRPTSHRVTVHVRHDPRHPAGGSIAVMADDVTEERERVARLVHQLEHDRTTGLLNRSSAIDRVAAALERPSLGTVAVYMIDIDRLADVNDALGHDIGDRLLASTARRLATAVRPDDLVARMGGDEFLVLCTSLADPPAAMELADRIRRSLTGRLTIHQLELDVSVSVGVAIAGATGEASGDAAFEIHHQPAASSGGASSGAAVPGASGDEPTDVEIDETDPRRRALELISQADTAVHAAKHGGRARTAQFTEQLASQARVRTELSSALSKALRDEQLTIEYQSIFSAVSELAEAAEALLRWNHPTRGRVEAGEFIPIAEETGVIVPIGDWVLQQACATARQWIDDGLVGGRFSVHVNVSRLQLASPSFVNRVVDLLREYRLRPRQIVLEVREASLVDRDSDEVVRSVRALRRVGVRVAIDNFGTGSHALSLMTDIGADVLKLDGSLALPNGASETDTRVVRALVLLAHALNMEVVAERVTGLEQLRRLRAAGCDLVQGHLVGSPTPPDQLIVQMEL
jgi:diguanylate cyclase (GGDEF)-like protein